MALPSSSGQGGDKDFIATVAVKVDPATLDAVGAQIRDALRKATEGVDLKAISELAKSVKILADDTAKSATNAERLKQAHERTNQEVQKTLLATQRVATEQERTAAIRARATAESEKAAKFAEQEARAVAAIAEARTRALTVNPNFNLGNLAGGLGNNFLSTLLSGGGINAAISQSLGQLQPKLFEVAQGGKAASDAFNDLGIKGVGAVSGITSGMAALGVAALAVVPVIGAIGSAIKGAYEQQKDFVFQSGLLSKQLGTTAEEGAKLRALLTAVGQQDNIFAAITLNQIQASVAALDRVNKGLETASPQIEKFGQALTQLGVSYQNNNGSLKTFAELTVDISAGLQKLDTAQRSLAIQNLAGLFGSDVAKIFGLGPEGLTRLLQNATVVTDEQVKANDKLQISLANLTAAQTEFNLKLTEGITPLETWFNTVKAGATREATDILGELQARIEGVNQAALEGTGELFGKVLARTLVGPGPLFDPIADLFFPDEAALRARADNLRATIANLSSQTRLGESFDVGPYEAELAKIQARLEEIASIRFGGFDKSRDILGVDEVGPSTAALKKQYGELAKAVDEAIDAEKELADVQKEVAKNNLDVAKSFDAQINALQKTAEGYDKFYEKIGDIQARIDERQAKVGLPFSFIGDGSKVTKDIELAIANVRVMEERLGKINTEKSPAAYDKLALQISRLRGSLGLQPGEAATIENVDVKFGYSGLSPKDKLKLEEDIAALAELKKEFLQGGFDTAQSTFALLAQGLGDLSQPEFLKFLSGGAGTLQDFATQLGLFASPGFAQAIGEAGLQAKLLAGGFGDITTAAGATAAYENYVDALRGVQSELFDFAAYIADPSKLKLDTIFKDLEDYEKKPKKFKIPIAIELGLVTAYEVKLAGFTGDFAPIVDEAIQGLTGTRQGDETISVEAQKAAQKAAQDKIGGLKSGQGIVSAILAPYGVTPGQAIEAALDVTLDLKLDDSLVQKGIDAQDKLAKELGKTRQINAKWNLNIDLSSNLSEVAEYLRSVLNALGLPSGTVPTQPGPPEVFDPRNSGLPGAGRAAGGDVLRGLPYLIGEEGKPELFVPPSNGRIIPGNDTAALMRMFSGRERLPVPQTINYAPVVNQNLTVDARGTNARDVTQAIKRTQSKSLFTSSSDLVRNRDFLRSRGLA